MTVVMDFFFFFFFAFLTQAGLGQLSIEDFSGHPYIPDSPQKKKS